MDFLIFLVNFIGSYVVGNLGVVMQGGGTIGSTGGILVEAEDKQLPIVLQYFLEHYSIAFFLPLGHLYFGTICTPFHEIVSVGLPRFQLAEHE